MQCPLLGTSDNIVYSPDAGKWVPWISELKKFCLSGNHGDCNVFRNNSDGSAFCVVPEVVMCEWGA